MAKKSKPPTNIVPISFTEDIKKRERAIVKEANALAIKSAKDEELAYDGLQKIKKVLKTIEIKRKEITQPLNASLKAANNLFKTLSSPFNEADTTVRQKIMAFREEEERKAREEEEQLRKKEEEARRQARLSQHEAKKSETEQDEEEWEESAEEWEKEAEKVEEQRLSTRPMTSKETSTFRRWTWKIVDETKIPDEYWRLDSAAINTAVRDGERCIPGIEIYQEEKVRV